MAALIASLSESALRERDARRQRKGKILKSLSGGALWLLVTIVILMICTILVKGLPSLTWEFLSTHPVEGMTAGGIWPMLRGSILLMVGTLAITLPIGLLGGIYLAEYASDTKIVRTFRSLIATLAGTPSIIFGLFGLAIFVLKLKLGTSLLAGWLTLAMFSIPVVVLTTEQAIRAVPHWIKDGAIALGLSRWQTIARVLLPAAVPGIATGLVLTSARAAGEAPPILLTAALYYSTEKLSLGWETLTRPVANLPYHLAEGYRQGGVIPERIIWGTCLTLMLFVLSINLVAILVRSRARAKQKW